MLTYNDNYTLAISNNAYNTHRKKHSEVAQVRMETKVHVSPLTFAFDRVIVSLKYNNSALRTLISNRIKKRFDRSKMISEFFIKSLPDIFRVYGKKI